MKVLERLSLCLALASLLLQGCSEAKPPSGEDGSIGRVALIAPQMDGALADSIRLGAEAAAKEFGCELIYIEDTAGQHEAARKALNNGASVLMLDPDSFGQLESIVQMVNNSGGSVVTLNDAYPVKGVASTVTINNLDAGRLAGGAMAELLQGKGRVALLGSDLHAPGYVERAQGVLEELSRHPGITINAGYSCGSSPDGCAEAARQLMGEVDGIVAVQEQGVLSAANESVRQGKGSRIRIVGFGSETPQLEMLQDGIIDQLIVQSGFNAGYLGMKQAGAVLRGEEPEAKLTLATKAVTPDSMFWMDNQKLLFPFVK
ncbi:substrate-binding domain-containing protein [Paenibacillus pasadenensis]|uniref:substrate-binding domain-containing protein n=1 Tax=Paenibacillus pasadenensis TaxID=217090 RepID=UPI00203BEE57|nr:substrate-binding domain-containing protein [Paenibacillus pasadenensis]MCM3749898.1 substrate-binding domain-containing protein [Paenibacillus pasadenensis]